MADDEAEAGPLQRLPAEQAAIARMRALRGEGLSLRAIRDAMAAEGHRLSHNAVDRAVRGEA